MTQILLIGAVDAAARKYGQMLRDWQVHRAAGLDEALAWAGPAPDAVLLELRPRAEPERDPEDLVAQVVDKFRLSAVILLCTLKDEEFAERCLDMGAQGHILKTIEVPETWRRAVRQAIARKARVRQEIEDSRADMVVDAEQIEAIVRRVVDRGTGAVLGKFERVKEAMGVDTGVISLKPAQAAALELAALQRKLEDLEAKAGEAKGREARGTDEERQQLEAELEKAERRAKRRARVEAIASVLEGKTHPIAAKIMGFVAWLSTAVATVYAMGEDALESIRNTEEVVERLEAELLDTGSLAGEQARVDTGDGL
jgi:DNA-binding NarL/FixJ family response regulator